MAVVACWYCGKVRERRNAEDNRNRRLGKRNFCSSSCASKTQRLDNPPENPSRSTIYRWAHNAAKKLFPSPWKCEVCGFMATDVHHKDRNSTNNAPENLMILCRGCHVTIHNRARETGRGSRNRERRS